MAVCLREGERREEVSDSVKGEREREGGREEEVRRQRRKRCMNAVEGSFVRVGDRIRGGRVSERRVGGG